MDFIERIQDVIDSVDEKKLYTYISVGIILFGLGIGLFIFQYYRTINNARSAIEETNELREDAQSILGKLEQVKKQRAEVDAMLLKEPNFKIGGYFDELLKRMHLANKKTMGTTSTADLDEKYRESIYTVKFAGMNMRELTQLLNEIEQKERLYTKRLEIQKSKKNPQTIDVDLTVATLQLKAGTAS